MKPLYPLLILSLVLVACNAGSQETAVQTDVHRSGNGVTTGINIGERAPELVFESPSGENIALSSLRGKMVLIDFWASWCSPCRQENPHLVRTYTHFRDSSFVEGEGFTIYGVSLDKSSEAWQAAIEKDGLAWEAHVSDLKGWKSAPAAMYGVMSIPMNFLIDGKGIIVARGLRGAALDEQLRALLKQDMAR